MKNNKILIFIFIFIFYFLFLNSYGLIDPDEPRYATTAKNMVTTGNYIIPEFNGKLRINKPPLTYWLISISYKIFGINEFSARIPHALLGFLLIIFLFIFTKDILPSVVLASTPFFIFFARLCNTDMILTFFFSISLLCFFKFYENKDKKSLIIFLFSYLLSNLTKGPVSFLILLIILIFLITERNFLYFKKFSIIIVICLFSLSSLIWLFLVSIHTGEVNSLKNLIFNETFGRMFKGYAHKEPFYYYLIYFPLVFFPWSILFFQKIFNFKKIFFENKFIKFNIIWFLTVFLFFSLSKSKLLSYILPLSVPFSVIVSQLIKNYNFNFNIKKLFLSSCCLLFILTLYLLYEKEFRFNLLIFIFIFLGIILWLRLDYFDNKFSLGIIIIFVVTGILTISGKFITDLKSEKFLQEIKFPKEFEIIVFRKKLTGCAFYKKNYKKIDSLTEIIKYKKPDIFILTSTGMFKKYLSEYNKFKIVYKTKGRVLLN